MESVSCAGWAPCECDWAPDRSHHSNAAFTLAFACVPPAAPARLSPPKMAGSASPLTSAGSLVQTCGTQTRPRTPEANAPPERHEPPPPASPAQTLPRSTAKRQPNAPHHRTKRNRSSTPHRPPTAPDPHSGLGPDMEPLTALVRLERAGASVALICGVSTQAICRVSWAGGAWRVAGGWALLRGPGCLRSISPDRSRELVSGSGLCFFV